VITLNINYRPPKKQGPGWHLPWPPLVGIRDADGTIHGLENLVRCPGCGCVGGQRGEAGLVMIDNLVVCQSCGIVAEIKDTPDAAKAV
jgi:hypothetical protein